MERVSTTHSSARSRCCGARGSRPVRSCCSPTAPTSAAEARSTKRSPPRRSNSVRIFTVGLRSGAFEAAPLQEIADRTGGSYAEARSAAELEAVYEALGDQLAGEYILRYRSAARPMSQVEVGVEVAGVGHATAGYAAPTPSLLAPYHRPALSRFLLSSSSPLLISLFLGLLACSLVLLFARRPRTTVVSRVRTFSGATPGARTERAAGAALRVAARNRYASGWWADLERDLEIARMTATPRQVAGLALAGTLAIGVLALMLSAPLIALFGLTTPLIARAVVRRKVKAVRARVRRAVPGEPPGARFGASRGPQLQRRARSGRRQRARAGTVGTGPRRPGRSSRRPA